MLSRWTGISVSRMLVSDKDRLLKNMEYLLRQLVVGRNDAVESVSYAIRRNRSGLSDLKKTYWFHLYF